MNPNWSDTTRDAVHDRDDHWLCDIEFGPGNTTLSQSRTKCLKLWIKGNTCMNRLALGIPTSGYLTAGAINECIENFANTSAMSDIMSEHKSTRGDPCLSQSFATV